MPAMNDAASWFGGSATAVASLVAIVALFYAGKQLRVAREAAEATRDATERASDAAKAELLLNLEGFWAQHSEVHMRLRPGGKWAKSGAGPRNSADWATVEQYMGVFERMNYLVTLGYLEASYVANFYGYRISNIWANEKIWKAKLIDERAHWADFLQISKRVTSAAPGRFPQIERFLQ